MQSFSSLILLSTVFALGALAADPMLVGYYMKVARWRTSPGTLAPKQLDASLLTHCVFYSAEIDDQGNVIVADSGDARVYDEFHYWVRSQNSAVKTLLSIGGWDLNTNVETKGYFSSVASIASKRANFAASAVAFARKYDFDGISLDWFFPAFVTQGGTSADKANFVLLVADLKTAIYNDAQSTGETALIFSLTVAGNLDVADAAYDVAQLSNLVDFFNVMTYDYAGAWSTKTAIHTDFPSLKDSLDFFLVQGAPKEKLLLSTATFGRSFTVQASANTAEVDISVSGVGAALTASNSAGLVSYYEIQTLKQDSSAVSGTDALSGGSILTYNSNQWVGYDDVDAVKTKAQYVLDEGLAGMMVWSIDLDDFSNGFTLTSTASKTLGISSGSSGNSTDPNSANNIASMSLLTLILSIPFMLF